MGSNGDIESWFNYSYLSFPAIAEALLIAVEALEEIKNGNVVCDSRNGDKGCDNKAHNALSRIRSIPL